MSPLVWPRHGPPDRQGAQERHRDAQGRRGAVQPVQQRGEV